MGTRYMYDTAENAARKDFFISECITNAGRRLIATQTFNALEPYEEAWGADVCTRSAEELQPVITELVGFRSSSKKLRLTILREYVRWCIENGVPGACDGLLQIEEVGLEKLKRQMVANPQHLQRYLDCICDKESEGTVDCIYRCFFWLAYGGMNESDVLNVTASDVDLPEMVVRYGDVEYPIYREALGAFKNCVSLTQFRYKHPNYPADKLVFKDRAPGDTLLRGISEARSLTALRVEMSRRAKNPKYKIKSDDDSLNLKLSFYRVWLSGLFYKTYKAERAGIPVDFMAAAGDFMDGKTYHLERSRNLIGAKQRQIASDYLEDYSRWKEAYSI